MSDDFYFEIYACFLNILELFSLEQQTRHIYINNSEIQT